MKLSQLFYVNQLGALVFMFRVGICWCQVFVYVWEWCNDKTGEDFAAWQVMKWLAGRTAVGVCRSMMNMHAGRWVCK